jgi:hypothetical protein
MIKFKILLLLLFLDIISISRASEIVLKIHIPIDTSNIISYKDKLGLYIYTINKFRTYEFKNAELGTKLKFQPNGQTNLGLGFNYKWMGIGLAIGIPYFNRDNDVFGETKRFDIQLNLFSRFYGINAYYQKYHGFYLSNPKDFAIWEKNSYPIMGDMQCSSMGISAFYWFNNRKFSYKAAYVRNEVQQKSAGGLVLGIFADADVLNAPSGFIPKALPDSLIKIFDFKGYSTFVAGVTLGYAYTLKFFKRAFINLSLVPGIGYRQLTISYLTSSDKTKPNITGSLKGKFSIGIETKYFYLGTSSFAGIESFKYEEVDISSTSGQVRFYIGKRFNIGNKHRTILEPENN